MVNRIKTLCRDAGITIQQLEKDLGMGNGAISKWENSVPKADRLYKVAERLNVSAEYLLTGKTESETEEDQIKFALFGTSDVTDETYAEVKRFAKFALEQQNRSRTK